MATMGYGITNIVQSIEPRSDWDDLELLTRDDFANAIVHVAIAGYDHVGDRHYFVFTLPHTFLFGPHASLAAIQELIQTKLDALPRNLAPMA